MKSGAPRYAFGPFTLIPADHVLLRDGQPVHLTRKGFELLVALVEHAGHLVRKEDLQDRLWPDAIVEEGNLTKHVSMLRKVLSEPEGVAVMIETVPRVGFRFVAPVELADNEPAPTVPNASTRGRRVAAIVVALLVLAALGARWYGARKSAPPTSRSWTAFAVLPFTSLDEPDADDPLGMGLADGIIARLSSQRLVPVRPTSAITRYRGPNRPPSSDIGRALGVDALLEGHIQRLGTDVRVTVQLIDVGAGSPVWAESFDQPAAELFRVEDAVADRVARALRLRLAAVEQQRLRRRYTDNVAAYTAYVEGRSELLRYRAASTRRAAAAFERALAIDPGYTLARAGLAMASADMYLRFAPPSEVGEWGERAEREALRALELDPDLAEAHLARAAVLRKREFNWDETVAVSRRALVLNPNLDQPHFFTAAAFYHSGLMEEAVAEMERGRRVGGADVVEPHRIEALVALFSGRFAVARQRLEEVSRESSASIGDTYLALACYYSGDLPRARRMLERLATEPSAATSTRSRAALASVLGASERRSAERLLEEALAAGYMDHHVAYSAGAAFAQLGEHRLAVDWLRKAADTGFPCDVWYSRDPLLGPVRDDEGFRQLMADLAARRQAAASRYAAR